MIRPLVRLQSWVGQSLERRIAAYAMIGMLAVSLVLGLLSVLGTLSLLVRQFEQEALHRLDRAASQLELKLSVFDKSLNDLAANPLLGQNDDGGANVAPDSVTGARFDTFFTVNLAPGTYTTSVMAYSNFAVGPNLANGFSGGGSFTDFTGNRRTNQWAFDILNVESAVLGGVPEPTTWAMLVLGFGMLGAGMRASRKRSQLSVNYA